MVITLVVWVEGGSPRPQKKILKDFDFILYYY